ncbi:hypothetical protein [Enorma phocaeensis]|uniref:hypothetical protein n=1 Tax=Enorma phocaeensis TaxID=1871019 RepID=UPI0025A3120C|nr:hypothetical protein [Enorma phocaeensis]
MRAANALGAAERQAWPLRRGAQDAADITVSPGISLLLDGLKSQAMFSPFRSLGTGLKGHVVLVIVELRREKTRVTGQFIQFFLFQHRLIHYLLILIHFPVDADNHMTPLAAPAARQRPHAGRRAAAELQAKTFLHRLPSAPVKSCSDRDLATVPSPSPGTPPDPM